MNKDYSQRTMVIISATIFLIFIGILALKDSMQAEAGLNKIMDACGGAGCIKGEFYAFEDGCLSLKVSGRKQVICGSFVAAEIK